MDEYQQKDLRAKWAAIWVSIGTILIAAMVAGVGYFNFQQQVKQSQEQVRQFQERFQAEQEAQREQREKDYRLKFYDRQVEVYLELCELSSKLATTRQRSAADVQKFDQLLVGRLSVVGDDEVVETASRFNRLLRGKWISPPDELRIPPPTLPQLAFEVSNACRRSLEKAFPGVKIGTLGKYGNLGPVGPEPE
jgi:hypothetical protein